MNALDRGEAGGDKDAARALALKLAGSGNGKIRCPGCHWQPRKNSLWGCGVCGTNWNTFDTRGTCPGCSKQYVRTICLKCLKWFDHEAWYVKADE